MLGIGKVPQLLRTRDIERLILDGLADQEPGGEAWIITPYSTMDKLGSVRRGINEACRSDVRVKFVVRDEPEQIRSAEKGLVEAREYGLELLAFHRLHAKLYWFEDMFAIVTSANLVEGSFEASTELGLFVPFGGLHDELRDWIKVDIEPKLRPIGTSTRKRSPRPKRAENSQQRRDVKSRSGGNCRVCQLNCVSSPS